MNIMNKIKMDRYREIFNLLDSDHDGKISTDQMEIASISFSFSFSNTHF